MFSIFDHIEAPKEESKDQMNVPLLEKLQLLICLRNIDHSEKGIDGKTDSAIDLLTMAARLLPDEGVKQVVTKVSLSELMSS